MEKYHVLGCTCENPEEKLNVCKCPKKKTEYVYICKSEYEKCPKLNIHGQYKWCKLCKLVVCHYHCFDCKKILPNGFFIHQKTVLHQGKLCGEYC